MRAGLFGALSLLVSACATYRPQPLPEGDDLARHIPALQVDAAELRMPGLRRHRFAPGDGLDMMETATLAVLNNPKLKASRLRRGVRQAQVFAAGLLPDPQLDLSLEHPTAGSDTLNAYSLGLSEGLRALINRAAAQQGAKARARQVDLESLWQEWQVAEKARQLFVQLRAEQRLDAVYAAAQKLYARRYQRERAALARGDVTLAATASDLASLADAGSRRRALAQRRNRTRHELNALLGVRPQVSLALTGEPVTATPSAAEIETAIGELGRRRPDLVALRAGYRSQEAAVRQAVLDQFPSVTIGLTRARDTGGVTTLGFGLSIGLPLFDGGRGRIATERASRKQLRQEYQARLDAAVGTAHRVWRRAGLLERQRRAVRRQLPELQRMAERAERSLAAGNLDAGAYIALRAQLLAQRAETIRLESALQQARVGLETLLGRPLSPRENVPVPGNNGR